jgi:clan AA aspartic protease
MINGQVTARRQAMMRFDVHGDIGQSMSVNGAIDTGFTGYAILDPSQIALLGLRRVGSRSATLADGSKVMMDIYRATVVWDGQPRDIQILAGTGGTLVGMAMLYGYDVRIQVVDGGKVIIERMP